MKKMKKVLLLVLCAALLVGATIAGTVAYLTSQDVVTNTFTVGKVEITLDEAKVNEYGVEVTGVARVDSNEYKLIPGHTYVKDPTIHVAEGSETCWLFVKIVNTNANATINWAEGTKWVNIKDANGAATEYWAYPEIVSAKTDVLVFESFTYNNALNAVPNADVQASIVVTAYAIQSDSFPAYADAFAALKGQLNLG